MSSSPTDPSKPVDPAGPANPAGPERDRIILALIGAGAGGMLWYLFETLPDLTDDRRIALASITLTGGFFAVLLAALGPLRGGGALRVAVPVAALAAGLLSWASFRHDTVGDFLGTGHVIIAFLTLLALPVPFLIARASPGEGWRDYPALFHHAWRIFVRYLVAAVFVGLFWLLVLLSDQVLQIVGLDVIEKLLELDPVPWLLSGLMLGLGLAVVHELSAYISPYLALRLLRLMLPLVLLVSAVFLIAAPIRGLSNLFGSLSPAALLMAMAVAAVSLITAVLDASDAEGASHPLLLWSARLMALLLPFPGGLAAWAIGQRVVQYGWTPDRLAAAVSAFVVLAYGLTYALSVLRGPGWRAHIRRANIWMALGMIALAALWLSPVLNAERISTRSQIARFEAGKVAPGALDLWAIAHDWGRAGQAGLARLSAPDHPRAAALAAPLARLAEADSRWQWQSEGGATGPGLSAQIRELLPVYPPGAVLPDALPREPDWQARVLKACRETTPGGNPGCVAWVADFSPGVAGLEVLYMYLGPDRRVELRGRDQAGAYVFTSNSEAEDRMSVDVSVLDKVFSGALSVSRAPGQFLLMGESIIVVEED